MKILLTGAFGNIGNHTIKQLLDHNYIVRAFDVKNPNNIKAAKVYNGQIEVIWGDIRKYESVFPAVEGVDAIIHLAAIIPPPSEKHPKLCYEVNVNGTKNLIDAIKAQNPQPKLIFTSSISVFGDTQHLPPPRKITDPVMASDNYSASKLECEKMVKTSGITHTILRLTAVAPVDIGSKIDADAIKILFQIPPQTRIEYCHPADVARALVNALSSTEVWGNIYLIGGGAGCQMRYRDYVSRILDAIGVGALPDNAFQTSGHFYTDWLDSNESQRVLNYQTISFESYAQEIVRNNRVRKVFIEMVSDVAKAFLVSKSPYTPPSKMKQKMTQLKQKMSRKAEIPEKTAKTQTEVPAKKE